MAKQVHKCPVCSEKFDSPQGLSCHWRMGHPDEWAKARKGKSARKVSVKKGKLKSSIPSKVGRKYKVRSEFVELTSRWKFCPFCGVRCVEIPDAKFCHNCGKPLPE